MKLSGASRPGPDGVPFAAWKRLGKEGIDILLMMARCLENGLDPENDAALFLGLGSQSMAGRMAVCVMPQLAEFIGEELTKEASVAKGKVKAHELRQQLRNLAGGGKSGGGGL